MAVVHFPIHRVRAYQPVRRTPWPGTAAAVGAATLQLVALLLDSAIPAALIALALGAASVLLALDLRHALTPVQVAAVVALFGAAVLVALGVDAVPLTVLGLLAVGMGGAFAQGGVRDLLDGVENEPLVLPERPEPVDLPRAA